MALLAGVFTLSTGAMAQSQHHGFDWHQNYGYGQSQNQNNSYWNAETLDQYAINNLKNFHQYLGITAQQETAWANYVKFMLPSNEPRIDYQYMWSLPYLERLQYMQNYQTVRYQFQQERFQAIQALYAVLTTQQQTLFAQNNWSNNGYGGHHGGGNNGGYGGMGGGHRGGMGGW